MHHIRIIGKYIILAMRSAKKHQDRSVLVLLTYRVPLHFTATNYGFQRKKMPTTESRQHRASFAKNRMPNNKDDSEICVIKVVGQDIFSMTSIDILPTKCNITPASPTDVKLRV